MYSNISQILLLYKTWWYYNKFACTKSLGACYWCVTIPQCGFMEHGLKHITFYVQKHIAALVTCYNPALVRNKQLGAPASVKLVYCNVRVKGYASEWVIEFNALSVDSGQWGPYSPHKPCNHSLYIGIIIFPHIDNSQSKGYARIRISQKKKNLGCNDSRHMQR